MRNTGNSCIDFYWGNLEKIQPGRYGLSWENGFETRQSIKAVGSEFDMNRWPALLNKKFENESCLLG
jgi:hypothetical protein